MSPLTITRGAEGRCSDEERSDAHDGRSKAVWCVNGTVGGQGEERRGCRPDEARALKYYDVNLEAR